MVIIYKVKIKHIGILNKRNSKPSMEVA